MKSIGIDIGSLSIKVVQLDTQANRGYRFGGAKIYPLKPDLADQEIQCLQVLKRITTDFNLEDARVTVALPQKMISLRKVFFPFKERQKILKSLAFEIEDDIPYSLEKAICEGKTLALHDNATEVMALTTPTINVSNHLEFLGKAGLDPDILSCAYGALANAYDEHWYRTPDGDSESDSSTRLGVYIGHRSTFAGLLQGQRMIWGREISWGGEIVAKALAKTLGIPYAETLKLMAEKSELIVGPSATGTTPDQVKISDSIKEATGDLVRALRFTHISAQTDFEVSVSSVEVFGGVAEIKNLGPFLTQSLELPVNVSNPLDAWSSGPVDALRPHKQSCVLALGLAIEGLKKPLNPPINFRKGDFVKKNLSFEKFWEKWKYTLQILAVAWACYLMAGIARNQIATNLDDASYDLLRNKTKKIAKISKFSNAKAKKYIKRQTKNVSLVKAYKGVDAIRSPMTLLAELSQRLPPNDGDKKYDIRHMFVENDTMKVHGLTSHAGIIPEIEKTLKAFSSNKKVKKIKSILAKETGKTFFSFELQVKRKD